MKKINNVYTNAEAAVWIIMMWMALSILFKFLIEKIIVPFFPYLPGIFKIAMSICLAGIGALYCTAYFLDYHQFPWDKIRRR